jgi:hypothetical protein
MDLMVLALRESKSRAYEGPSEASHGGSGAAPQESKANEGPSEACHGGGPPGRRPQEDLCTKINC